MKIDIDHVTRIEGHANVVIEVEDKQVKDVKFMPHEGRRYFEALLKDRMYYDAPITTSRICGVCSEAHLLTSIDAIEKAMGVESSAQTKLYRKLMLIASIIESHALHLYALAIPDYLGYESVISMAAVPELAPVVKEALSVKKLSNTILDVIGGRSTHPVTFVVGNMTHQPKPSSILLLAEKLKNIALPFAKKTVELCSKLDYPDFTNNQHEYCAVYNPNEYGVQGDFLKSSKRDIISIDKEAANYFIETEDPYHSNNVTHTQVSSTVVVDAMARVNLNKTQLTPNTLDLMKQLGIDSKFPSNNPFLNNLAQAIELYHFCDYTVNVLENTKINSDEKRIKVEQKAGRGISMQEVPRGTIMHEYVINEEGRIQRARVMAPTTFFTKAMDFDLKKFVSGQIEQDLSQSVITKNVEMLVRSYDPCISCATHDLKVEWKQLKNV